MKSYRFMCPTTVNLSWGAYLRVEVGILYNLGEILTGFRAKKMRTIAFCSDSHSIS